MKQEIKEPCPQCGGAGYKLGPHGEARGRCIAGCSGGYMEPPPKRCGDRDPLAKWREDNAWLFKSSERGPQTHIVYENYRLARHQLTNPTSLKEAAEVVLTIRARGGSAWWERL